MHLWAYLVNLFLTPLFAFVPAAGTAPLLFLVGMLLFQNVSRIDWKQVNASVPAFIVLFFIPFTYSIPCGIGFGYVLFITINLLTGNLQTLLIKFWSNINDESTVGTGSTKQDYEVIGKKDLDQIDNELEILEKIHSINDVDKSVTNHSNNDEIMRSRRRSESLIDTLFPMDLHHHDKDTHKSNFYH